MGNPRSHSNKTASSAWRVILAGAILAGLALPLYLVAHAHQVNGAHGFPLDDPWIHLTYARNLLAHHTLAYFPGDPSTTGTTSPLYTLLLTLGFSLFNDEKLLSYGLGLLIHLGFLLTLAAWVRSRLGSAWAVAAVALVALDGRVAILAVSGMETGLFLLLVTGVFYAREVRRPMLASAALGLCVWVRPDGLILLLALCLAQLLKQFWLRQRHGASWRKRLAVCLPAASLISGYFLFNLLLGGSILPNTFAGKTAYYQVNPRWIFIRGDLWDFLSTNAGLVLLPLLLLTLGHVAWSLLRRRPVPGGTPDLMAMSAWAVGLLAAYVLFLPYAHRMHRYLIPALPAMTLLSLYGLRMTHHLLKEWKLLPSGRAALVFIAAALVLALALQVRAVSLATEIYPRLCAYHKVRHEDTGRWLADNTPQDAVVATHDIGAMAFYSRRKVVDIVGLVLPEVTVHLHSKGYFKYLRSLFKREGVTHLAVLRNWLEVDNIAPLHVADPRPEVMEVFAWHPRRAHLVSPEIVRQRHRAASLLQQGRTMEALRALKTLTEKDPRGARGWLLKGQASEAAYQPQKAVAAYDRALSLDPANVGAREGLERLTTPIDGSQSVY